MKIIFLFVASMLMAQEAVTPVTLTASEKQFQEAMTNVTLTGFFTVGDSGETHEDRYTVEKISKVGDDLWNFDARIQYNKQDFRATVKVPVKWAGETAVLTLSNYLIKGEGVYSAHSDFQRYVRRNVGSPVARRKNVRKDREERAFCSAAAASRGSCADCF
jgi:hypothetical protein